MGKSESFENGGGDSSPKQHASPHSSRRSESNYAY